jgi:hypothetical protein
MSRFALFAVAVLSLSALSAEPVGPTVRIGTFEDWGQTVRGVKYEVDPARGRVRLVIALQFSSPDDDGRGELTRQVAGLRYDAERRQVLLERDGLSAVCATLTNESAVGSRWRSVEDSGHCTVATTRRRIMKDDGLETSEQLVQDLDLVVR